MHPLFASILSLALSLCFSPALVQAESDLELVPIEAETDAIVGGWNPAEDPMITEEIASLLERGLAGLPAEKNAASYSPVAYLGSQVVAGTNHAILCQAKEEGKLPRWEIVYLYEDLSGNVELINTAEWYFGDWFRYGDES